MSTGQMRTILFTHYGDDWLRGSERCLLDLLAHLDRRQFRPLLWCNSPSLAAAAGALDVPVWQRPFSILGGWQHPRADFAGYWRQCQEGLALIRRERVELLHANSAAPCQWLNPIARQARLPLLAHLHARYLPRDRCLLGLHQVSLVVGVSQPVLEGLRSDGMPEQRLRVIANGIDGTRLQAQPVVSVRNRLGVAQGVPLLASVGSLIPRKGFDLLLQALALLHRSAVPAHLLVIGSGPEETALRALARGLGLEQNVHWVGEQSDIHGWLTGGVDLFVSAAREEVFGLALVEAGLAGLAVIAPRIGGIPEVIADEKSGLLVAPESPMALANAMYHLLWRPDLCRELGRCGQHRALSQFSVQRYVGEIETCYRELLAAPQEHLHWLRWRGAGAWQRWFGAALQRRLFPAANALSVR